MTIGARSEPDTELVRRLLAEQFPPLADLPVRPVPIDGWDNRTFRLGEGLSVRLPGGAHYAPQVEKEVEWLPRLQAGLRLPIPEVVGVGRPGSGFPWSWTVRRWIGGVALRDAGPVDLVRLADDLAAFLADLRSVPTAGGPLPGPHSQQRGGPVSRWDDQVAEAIERLGARIDGLRAASIWREAVEAPSAGPARWLHGDMASGNLLLQSGRLAAVIDFGCCAVGDPACDLAIAWTGLDEGARGRFRRGTGADDAEWRRGAGWALWKSLIGLDDPREGPTAAAALEQLGVLPR